MGYCCPPLAQCSWYDNVCIVRTRLWSGNAVVESHDDMLCSVPHQFHVYPMSLWLLLSDFTAVQSLGCELHQLLNVHSWTASLSQLIIEQPRVRV